MNLYRIYIIFFSLLFFCSCSYEKSTEYNPLKDYISKEDHAFKFEIVDSIKGDNWTEFKIRMISGKWMTENEVKNNEWWHWVTVVIPDEIRHTESMMIISSNSTTNKIKVPSSDQNVINVALETNSIVANINNVPFQPTKFKGDKKLHRYEDDLIAYGWRKYLEGGAKDEDQEWLARFPMTRAVSRAMDVVQEISLSYNKVDSFFVTGASKRGWTAWTTALADDRVMGLAPVVIDMLNVYPSFKHHWRVYGDWSPAIEDYINEGIMDWMGSDEYKKLIKIVEPYSFRDKLKMPKFIVNASSDEFFVTDSWKFYWDDLYGKKHLSYIPNAGHSLYGSYVNNDIVSYYKTLINDKSLDFYNWKVNRDSVYINVDNNYNYEIKKWFATNKESRDFRKPVIGESWVSEDIAKNDSGKYGFKISKPEQGYKAVFFEIILKEDYNFPVTVSTGTVIVPDEYPYPDFQSPNPKGSR